MTEQNIIDEAASMGYPEFRRATDFVDQDGHYDAVIFFMSNRGGGIGIWFRGGCVVDEQYADREGIESYLKYIRGEGL